MNKFKFAGILLDKGWKDNVEVSIDEQGQLISIEPVKEDYTSFGFAIPGFQNAHSHAFQYAMAGLAEYHPKGQEADDFWGWRETMYKIALTMSPDDLESVATMLYAEMIRHGYTHVAEFHYLHHDKEGKPYQNLAEHGERLVSAAKTAGIKITLVPMYYRQGGFGLPPQPRQRRFISQSPVAYFNLLDASGRAVKAYEGASLGYGIHSLRAANAEDIKEILSQNELKGPFHIHISEQLKEVEDSLALHKARPVEWLLANVDVNANYHLVHATHLNDEEIAGIALSGAHVVLCPSTEGNLGDGLFPLNAYQDKGGKWSIGTDSHIGLNPCEELRLLDYGQRLITHKRTTFINQHYSHSGDYGFHQALLSGRAAVGKAQKEYFEIGKPFDAVVYDSNQPLLKMTTPQNRLSTVIYSSDSTWTNGTIINGEWKVKNNKHRQHEKIVNRFEKTIKALNIR